jgi:type IV secretory pathway VirD2 relaxase
MVSLLAEARSFRHHFRFIVSPEDGRDMADLRRFTRELIVQIERDLGTHLDWAAVDHWNTDNPHVHIIVRGRADDGQDLVIGRDYIGSGMRARVQELVTDELGPRTDRDIAQSIARQVESERWTPLDRQLLAEAHRQGIVDTVAVAGAERDSLQPHKIGRLRKLEALGLADEVGAGQWRLAPNLEAQLRALGDRGDIIKRMHQALSEKGIARPQERWAFDAPAGGEPVIGRLVARGLDDELRGSAWAVVDGIDGRPHHLRFADLDAATDAVPGAIVELRRYQDRNGGVRVALAVRSDLDVTAQVTAQGATWLDRQLVSDTQPALGEGFGADVRDALAARTDHLVGAGLATRHGQRIVFARALLETLRDKEVALTGAQLARDTGQNFKGLSEGDVIAGTYRRQLQLASGRFAMIDAGNGFSLVPWSPAIERHFGQALMGHARADGGIDWSFGRSPGIGL